MFVAASFAHADTLIDPTRPAFAQAKSSAVARSVDPTSSLTAIFLSGERRVAVLDGKVVKAGDRVGDIVIQEISADSVRFTRAGRVESARLPKQAASVRSDAGKQRMVQEISP
jgi:MSHA biogenesis protein MshK